MYCAHVRSIADSSQTHVQHVVVYVRRHGYLRTTIDKLVQPIAIHSASIEYGTLCLDHTKHSATRTLVLNPPPFVRL